MWWNYLVACSSKHFSKVSPSFVVFDGTRRIPQPCRNFLMCMHACMYVCVDVCMDVCMDIWMEKLQIKKFGVKYVHNLGCFAARFMWSYSLGNLTLRTSASGIWFLEKIKITHQRYVYMLYIHTCMCVCAVCYFDVF